jgi:hypothetical protein
MAGIGRDQANSRDIIKESLCLVRQKNVRKSEQNPSLSALPIQTVCDRTAFILQKSASAHG